MISCCFPLYSSSNTTFLAERRAQFYLKIMGAVSVALMCVGIALSWSQPDLLQLSEKAFSIELSGLGITVSGGLILLVYGLSKKRPKISFESLAAVASKLEKRVQPLVFEQIKSILNLSEELWESYSSELDYSLSIVSSEIRGTDLQSTWEEFLNIFQTSSSECIRLSYIAQTEILKGKIQVFPPLPNINQEASFDLTPLQAIEQQTHIDSTILHKLRTWFSKTPVVFKSHLELHDLHYCLTKISETSMGNEKIKSEWKAFLLSIHQKVSYRTPSGEYALFDCSIELEKIDGASVDIETIEKVDNLPQVELNEIYDICKISFKACYQNNTDVKIKDYLFKNNNQCFVFRDHSRRILGLVETQESMETSWFHPPKKKLFFHTLARRPDAKINMIDMFFKKIVMNSEEEKIVECYVLKNNAVAIKRYQNHGMTICKTFDDHYLMRSETTSPISFSDAAFYFFQNLVSSILVAQT